MEPSTTAGSNNAKDGEKLIVPETTTTTTITLTYLLDQKWFAPMLVDRLGAKDALRFAAVSRNCRVVRLQAPLDFDDTPATATGAGAEPRHSMNWADGMRIMPKCGTRYREYPTICSIPFY